MIQRIQTVYLLITIILISLTIAFPLMEFISSENVSYTVSVFGVYIDKSLIYNMWPLLVLSISNILAALGAILLFERRPVQIRLCFFLLLFFIGFYAVTGIYYWIWSERFLIGEIVFKWTLILPAINIILTYLAIQSIKKDEALIKATDRLR